MHEALTHSILLSSFLQKIKRVFLKQNFIEEGKIDTTMTFVNLLAKKLTLKPECGVETQYKSGSQIKECQSGIFTLVKKRKVS